MSDYEGTGIQVNDDVITHFSLFADYDPIVFESVVSEENGVRQWMLKLKLFERNDT